MHISAPAILLAVRAHGEHGAVVRVMTRDHGLLGGYIQGAHSRDKRPILIPANQVQIDLRARTEAQLPSLSVELIHSRGPLLSEPLAAAALDWATALTASALPEAHPYPMLYDMLDALLNAVEAAPAARNWAAALVRYELMILSELGYGLALEQCIVTGAEDNLIYVSPKSGAAVSAAAGTAYREKLLELPAFIRDSSHNPDWQDIYAGLTLTGHFLSKHILTERRADALTSRERLVDRLRRATA